MHRVSRPKTTVAPMFMLKYNHTLDPKGRVIIPSKWRETLGENFFVSKGMDPCLHIYANEAWEEFENKLAQLPMEDERARRVVRYFLAGAAQVETDKQGRILLPTELRTFAGLDEDNEVVMVGMGNHIELWSKSRYETVTAEDDVNELIKSMADLNLNFKF